MVKGFTQVSISEQANMRLDHISKVTNIPKSRILEMFIEELFSLSIEYDRATLSISSRVTEDTVYTVLHGYGKKMTMGKCATEQELEKVTFDKINEDLKKKAVGLNE